MKPKLIYSLLFLISLAGCKSRQVKLQTLARIDTPPGTTKISPNVYLDESEISNFAYLEFVLWMKNVFGESSVEFKSVNPDSTKWDKTSVWNLPYFSYCKHPAYKDLPVLNISLVQARKYSKWRSDRVMEFLLIREGLIKHIPSSKIQKDSIFTIESYFTGKYRNISPHPNIKYYPDFEVFNANQDNSTLYGFRNVCVWKEWSR
ncbi:MAG: SUMF1/EgtB/PvdO family nonheme iron enzyme [Bacteroidia bacterium]